VGILVPIKESGEKTMNRSGHTSSGIMEHH